MNQNILPQIADPHGINTLNFALVRHRQDLMAVVENAEVVNERLHNEEIDHKDRLERMSMMVSKGSRIERC